MDYKVICDATDPPIGGLASIALTNVEKLRDIEWGSQTAITFKNSELSIGDSSSEVDLLRNIARLYPIHNLYGATAIERTQVDHWLTFSLSLEHDLSAGLSYLQKCLGPITYLVANKLTISDLAVYSILYKHLNDIEKIGIPNHVQRWYKLIDGQASLQTARECLTKRPQNLSIGKTAKEQTNSGYSSERKQEGKFVDLPGAEIGKVVVRFPPEASGYLHIGHAKAALLNQYYQQAFQGKLIMRFDDTNPAKETVEFENVILGDLELLKIKPDVFTHTSQYFDLMLTYCEQLIQQGKAYVDDTDAEQMKKEREQRIESLNRSNSPEKNLKLWNEMINGSAIGQKCCVRAKIDMLSDNGCMRDPTIYRCKNEPHPRTGTKYKVYPTYDFACPIVDAIEGVTHTLRTMEYHDRDDQFYWFIDMLKLRKPYIWEYSRLNMKNTVLSKRKLTWFVDQHLVDGWDDPRFPTVRGILRRGMTVDGLKEFIIAQGSSKSVVFMEWDKIWAFNKKVIDPVSPRYTALELGKTVTVNVAGAKLEATQVAAHPKNADVGMKTVWIGPKVFIDMIDATVLKEGENATFINWGNLLIKRIHKDSNDVITCIDAELNLDNKDFKKTLKLTWLCDTDGIDDYPPTFCVYFEHIISKGVLGRDEDFKQYIGHETRKEVSMLGDPELKKLKKGDIIQLQRRGFFKVDNAYAPPSQFTSVAAPVVLFEIPDGHAVKTVTTAVEQPTKAKSISTKKLPSVPDINYNDLIIEQGNVVRDLKSNKADKNSISAAVQILLGYKAKFKEATGQDWKPDLYNVKPEPINDTVSATNLLDDSKLNDLIIKQGELVRDLKSKKAQKPEIDAAVKILLAHKADYKSTTGSDWKPDNLVSSPKPSSVPVQISQTTEVDNLSDSITKQGDLVRNLKTQKVSKTEIDAAVKELLRLKAEFKSSTGHDWKPQPNNASPTPIKTSSTDTNILWESISKQGDLVWNLQSQEASKPEIDNAVKELLSLKANFKATTGLDWIPQTSTPTAPTKSKSNNDSAIDQLSEMIAEQGEIVRKLKAQKSPKAEIDSAVKELLKYKADYKTATGADWKPPPTPQAVKEILYTNKLSELITKQSNIVRNLKMQNALKGDIDEAVKEFLNLTSDYKAATGMVWKPNIQTPLISNMQRNFVSVRGPDPPTESPIPDNTREIKEESPTRTQEKIKNKKGKTTATTVNNDSSEAGTSGLKKQTRLGMEATKEDNLPEWYSQIITKGELIEYYDVSGCYILRPWSFAIWKTIKNWFDNEITKLGVKEVYFPIFVSKAALEKEKSHIADFSPEVAWVTRSGDSELAEPIAIRPTSETVMYPAYAKWIRTYRDLPLRLNQWNNVVRWEFKHPQPFLRTREFLWQEGHTAFATFEEAEEEVYTILDLYAQVYTDLLAIPVIKGRKTEKEKFAGGYITTTVEAYISASGRAIQGATSHMLGQNFSKMFEIVFDDPVTQEKKYVYQNSWGITTRTIGVMVMVHADNHGLILPPRVAAVQSIIVPCGITVNMDENDRIELHNMCTKLEQRLRAIDVRAEGDYRDNYSPGWKFNYWELKGVPIRIELGPKDLKSNQLVAVRRDTGHKIAIPLSDLETKIPELLNAIQQSLYDKANKEMNDHIVETKVWSEFILNLEEKNLLLSPFCGDMDCEKLIKDDSAKGSDMDAGAALAMGAKSLCIPFDQPAQITDGDTCIHPVCKRRPKFYTLFGRSY